MFRMAKYLFIITLYRRIKANIVTTLVAALLLAISMLMMGDVASVAQKDDLYTVLLIKWMVILIFLFVIIYNIIKILETAFSPFDAREIRKKSPTREHILGKERLCSRSDRVLDKYTGEALR